MRSIALVSVAWATLVAAGNSQNGSPSAAQSPGWTEWLVSTDYVPTTVYEKETDYKTAYSTDYSTIYSTIYSTVYSTVTATAISTEYKTVTDYVTVTQTETDTEYKTITNYISVTGPAVTTTQTVTSTAVGPGSTVTAPGGTVTQIITSTVAGPGTTVTLPGGTATQIITSTVVGPGTTVTLPGGTVTQIITSTVAGPGSTVTEIDTVTGPGATVTATVAGPGQTVTETDIETVSTCASQSLSGLVTCTSRIINPTYTPPAPLPTDYLWGCPPGQLCHPKRENCNFEQNPPADSYYCSPDECIPVAQLPPIETWLNYEDINNTCALITPIDDYFNINPTFFGLGFSIFDIYGQPRCSYSPPCLSSTVTVTAQIPGSPVTIATTVQIPGSPVTVPTTIQIPGSPVTVPTTIQIPGSPVTVPTTVTVVSSQWQPWSSSAPVAESQTWHESPSTSGWGKWGQTSAPPQVTKRAELADRDLQERAPIVVARQCYAVCDYAAAVYQSIGNRQALCSSSGSWAIALSRVQSCTRRYTATGVTSVAVVLNKPISYVNAHCRPTKRALFGRPALW